MSLPKTKASAPTARRFYRSNLSTIVWDPSSGQPMADFSAGHFTTENPKVARKLIELGYIEIPLDAEEPPTDIIVSQPTAAIDGDVPVIRSLQNPVMKPTAAVERQAEINMNARTHTVGGPPELSAEAKSKTSRSGGITKLPKRRKRKAE